MSGDDAVRHRQSEPGPLATCSGGEKWLEDLVLDILRHADTGVLHAHLDMRSRRKTAVDPREILIDHEHSDGHGEGAAFVTHRLCGVGAQVHHHLMDLGVIAKDRRAVRIVGEPDVDGGGNRGAQ